MGVYSVVYICNEVYRPELYVPVPAGAVRAACKPEGEAGSVPCPTRALAYTV